MSIFQPQHPTSPKSTSAHFTLFPLLPAELRIEIWRTSLQRQRILKVRLRGCEHGQDHSHHERSTPRYEVVADGYGVMTKLLRINKESRDVALGFYRVRVPVKFTSGECYSRVDGDTGMGTLHFNPIYDFLHIKPDDSTYDPRHIIDFLHDLRYRYDPLRHEGLRNICLDTEGLDSLTGLDMSCIAAEKRQSIQQVIETIDEIFFACVQRTGRMVLGIWSGAQEDEYSFNRAFPITGARLTFDRLAKDPREGIKTSLRRVYLTDDPSGMIRSWDKLLDMFEVDKMARRRARRRVLVTFSPADGEHEACDLESAKRWLKDEGELWDGLMKEMSTQQDAPRLEVDGGNNSGSDFESAFGFWLFGTEPFVSDGEEEEKQQGDPGNGFVDLSKHVPELGLLELSSGCQRPKCQL
jgi:hypothetical protein